MVLNELKALANDKRLKVLYALSYHDFCQIHIIEITGLSQVDASRSLKALIESGLVESRKKGNRVIYTLSTKMKDDYSVQLKAITEEYNYLSYDVDLNGLVNECCNMVD